MAASLEEYAPIAQRYVASNRRLREALGIGRDATIALEPLGEGEHNLNYKVRVLDCAPPAENPASVFVLRINVLPQPFHSCQVRYEHEALTCIAPSGCTPLPLFMDASPEAPGEGVLAETFCPGRQLDFDALAPDDLERAAKIMADIHAVPVPKACSLHQPKDPLRDLFSECMERFELYHGSAFEDARISRWVDLFCVGTAQAIEDAGEAEGCPHIVNTETLASHFLLPEEEQGGWFIDWERPIVGEVAQDLAFFLAPTTTFWDSDFLFPASEVNGFLDQYWKAVDDRFQRDGFERRMPAWMRVSILRAIAWCCKALIRYGQSNEHTTAKAAAKIPTYLSDDFLETLYRTYFSPVQGK